MKLPRFFNGLLGKKLRHDSEIIPIKSIHNQETNCLFCRKRCTINALRCKCGTLFFGNVFKDQSNQS